MGSESVDAINMLLGFMPGIMVSYNGEEIGMEDTLISWNEAVDVSGINRGRYRYLDWDASRDPERTPMQWSTCRNAGTTVIVFTLKFVIDVNVFLILTYRCCCCC